MFQKYLNTTEPYNFYFDIGTNYISCRIYTFRDLMYIDVSVNEEYVLTGQRVMSNQWILPYADGMRLGNFRFETYASDANEYVTAEGFNEPFKLMVYTRQEFAELTQS